MAKTISRTPVLDPEEYRPNRGSLIIFIGVRNGGTEGDEPKEYKGRDRWNRKDVSLGRWSQERTRIKECIGERPSLCYNLHSCIDSVKGQNEVYSTTIDHSLSTTGTHWVTEEQWVGRYAPPISPLFARHLSETRVEFHFLWREL